MKWMLHVKRNERRCPCRPPLLRRLHGGEDPGGEDSVPGGSVHLPRFRQQSHPPAWSPGGQRRMLTLLHMSAGSSHGERQESSSTHRIHTPQKNFLLLFFAMDTVQNICKNTNKKAAQNVALGKIYKWTDVCVEDLHKFFGLLLYMSLVSLPSLQDYWKQDHLLSVPTPSKVMTRDRFRSILWNIHLSDPEEDVDNDGKRGTPEHDKPLLDDILCACLSYYEPRRELAVDEMMVATKAKTGMTQHMKEKPMKWGMKLFVLAESQSGYTISFRIYTGKNTAASEHGLSYDAVMDLVQSSCLGTGYHIYTWTTFTPVRNCSWTWLA